MMPLAMNLPQGMPDGDDVIRLLAIIGGAAVGAFLTGFITQAIVRGYTGQKVPTWVVWTLRILGGVTLGWLVYLLVYGHGGGLFGGLGGGNGKDGGTGGPHETSPAVTAPKDVRPNEKDGSVGSPDKGNVLRIEVLGDEPLKKMAEAGKIKSADPERCYRVADDDPANLRTLKEVEKLIRERLDKEPPLKRIELILYKDSPQKKVARVADLKHWADERTPAASQEKLIVDYKEPGEDAPVR